MTNIIFRKKQNKRCLVLYSPRNCWNFNPGLKILFLNISILGFERGERKSLENYKKREFYQFVHIIVKRKLVLVSMSSISQEKFDDSVFLTTKMPKKYTKVLLDFFYVVDFFLVIFFS